MINMKKLSAFVLTAAMMASMAVNAMAAEVSPRYTSCPDCGRGRVQVETHDMWDIDVKDTTTYPCIHNGEHSVDVKLWEGTQYTYTCSSCKFWSQTFVKTTGRWKLGPYLGYRL